MCFVAIACIVVVGAELAPRLGDDSIVDWWFAYKFNTYAFPNCSTTRQCIFGGEVQPYPYGYGQQYLLASSQAGTTSTMSLHSDCLGTGDDPVARTFEQIYGGEAPNYVIWNDQFYREPQVSLSPACSSYSSDPTSCSAPWGHSKGALAWDSSGNGFVMQVTTPSWPGSGSSTYSRSEQGNTLGCIADDNVEVAQHFFALRLQLNDTKAVLQALQRASVVTDPANEQLVKLRNGPDDLMTLAKGLSQLDSSTDTFQAQLGIAGAKLIAKPHNLQVPVWQLVSSILQEPLRTATWWTSPAIDSAHAGEPGCWADGLASPLEVQVATSGQWDGVNFSLKGGLGTNHNHAKLAHSIGGSIAVMGDMNQQGSYSPDTRKCSSSQNGRGGLFFVLEDSVLHSGLELLMSGSTAPYVDDTNTTTTSIAPASDCGGAGVSSSSCKAAAKAAADCVYVYSADVVACGVSKWGCYKAATLPSGCPEKTSTTTPAPDDCGGAGIRSSSCRSTSKVALGCVYVYADDEIACDVVKWGCYASQSLPGICPEKSNVTFMV